MNVLNFVLLMAPASGEQNPWMSFLFLFLVILIFYMFMIRPQMKKQKDLRKYREELKKGDKVITTGGIYGKIIGISEKTVIIEVEDQSKLKIDKSAVLRDATDLEQRK